MKKQKSDKILIDKDFLMKVLKLQTDLKKKIENLEKNKIKKNKPEMENTLQIMDDNDFVLDCNIRYFGGQNVQKEQEFFKELAKMMKKYQVFTCQANLIKKF